MRFIKSTLVCLVSFVCLAACASRETGEQEKLDDAMKDAHHKFKDALHDGFNTKKDKSKDDKKN